MGFRRIVSHGSNAKGLFRGRTDGASPAVARKTNRPGLGERRSDELSRCNRPAISISRSRTPTPKSPASCFAARPVPHREYISDGQKILLQGDLTVYGARGQYQLIVRAVELRGLGALQAAFEKLKQKLAAEGLFALERKRPLPPFPQANRAGHIPNRRGDSRRPARHRRRNPGLEIILTPVPRPG